MIAGGGIVGLVVLGLWLYAIYDVITTDESMVRNLPKMVWLLLVIFLGVIGSLAWLLLGRPQADQFADPWQGRRYAQPVRETVIEDPRLDGLHPVVRDREERARLRVWEEQLRRREEHIKRLEGGSPRIDGDDEPDARQNNL